MRLAYLRKGSRSTRCAQGNEKPHPGALVTFSPAGTGTFAVRHAPEEGDLCTAVDVQMVVVGEDFYHIDTGYETPGRLAASSGNCLGPAEGEEWTCRSTTIELYQRSDAEFTLD